MSDDVQPAVPEPPSAPQTETTSPGQTAQAIDVDVDVDAAPGVGSTSVDRDDAVTGETTSAPIRPSAPRYSILASAGVALTATLVCGFFIVDQSGRHLSDPEATQVQHDALVLFARTSVLLALSEQCPNPPTPQQIETDVQDLAKYGDHLSVSFAWGKGNTSVRVVVSNLDIGVTVSEVAQAAKLRQLNAPIEQICTVAL